MTTSKYNVTQYPPAVDSPLISSTGLLDAISTYKTAVDGVLHLYSVASIHNTNKQLHDPVTHQVQFFNDLNSEGLPIKESRKGVVSDNLNNNIERQEDGLNEKHDIIIDNLPDNFTLSDLARENTEFIVYWIEKYRTSHDLVKELLHSSNLLPKSDTTDTYNKDNIFFNDFSESMFSLKPTCLYSAPRECHPIWDISGTFFKEDGGPDTVPHQYTGTSVYNIHHDTQQLAFIMSRKTSCLFRNNMKNILDCITIDERIEDTTTDPDELKLSTIKITTSERAHGGNLVPDHKHPLRMKENIEKITQIITATLSNMSYVLSYMDINQRNDTQEWDKVDILSNIEDTVTSVDLLHNKLSKTSTGTPLSLRDNQSVLK